MIEPIGSLLVKKSVLKDKETIQITGSKSVSNRLLILRALFGNIIIGNLSNSQDAKKKQKALSSTEEEIDIHHAGTAMRFLTSYFAIQEGRTTVLTGSERMKQRPIQYLVDALRILGADIEYIGEEGFPPLKIVGKKLQHSKTQISANVSSQFITSLLLIGGKLENGLELELIGEITSRSYLEMTLKMISEAHIQAEFIGNKIVVHPYEKIGTKSHVIPFEVESDWSSASYFYSLAAIGRKDIDLKSFKTYSMQGDSALKQIYWDFFGVNTITDEADFTISLCPEESYQRPKKVVLDMNDCPDIAQTVCVTATALLMPFHLTGLATLKVKETDRLVALQNELIKIGCQTEITEDSITSIGFTKPYEEISIKTYNDHRMAMSFAPYCLIKELTIEHAEVVEKSYPDFWTDFNKVTEQI